MLSLPLPLMLMLLLWVVVVVVVVVVVPAAVSTPCGKAGTTARPRLAPPPLRLQPLGHAPLARRERALEVFFNAEKVQGAGTPCIIAAIGAAPEHQVSEQIFIHKKP
jgi:hypothetical protein